MVSFFYVTFYPYHSAVRNLSVSSARSEPALPSGVYFSESNKHAVLVAVHKAFNLNKEMIEVVNSNFCISRFFQNSRRIEWIHQTNFEKQTANKRPLV